MLLDDWINAFMGLLHGTPAAAAPRSPEPSLSDEKQGLFGKYTVEPSTTDAQGPETKYGIGKPIRIKVRGKVAADQGAEEER